MQNIPRTFNGRPTITLLNSRTLFPLSFSFFLLMTEANMETIKLFEGRLSRGKKREKGF